MHVTVKACNIEEKMMTSQKLNLWNQGIGWLIQRERGEICSLAKNEPVHLQIGGNVEALFSLRESVSCCLLLARVLFTICYAPTDTIQAYLIRIYMESSEHDSTFILPPICNSRLIFILFQKRIMIFFSRSHPLFPDHALIFLRPFHLRVIPHPYYLRAWNRLAHFGKWTYFIKFFVSF